ncbi:MAG TPA: hypothetical protein VMW42_12065, partial [Desulfatiglandales bacterium]|nr:hypothetical protein [Desulfatiglandales bacterium]
TGIFCGVVTSILTGFLVSQHLRSRTEIAIRMDELTLFQRVGTTLGSLLFFISPSKFEKTLNWLSREHQTRNIKFIIAKAIHQQLERSFDDEVIRMHIRSYADHSSVAADLLTIITDVCFTIIKSPRNWFIDLDSKSVEHDKLGSSFEDALKKFDSQKLMALGYSEENVLLYPTHFIRFLDKPSDESIRRRVFLLDKKEWEDLLNPNYSDFYHKFMAPCKLAKIETRFVNLEELEGTINTVEESISRPLLKAKQANITQQDYDVFEKGALMVYIDPTSQPSKDSYSNNYGPILEFSIGPKVKKYSGFLDIIFSGRLNKRHGVYTPEEIEADYFDQKRVSQ